jgi:hypothetical protein
MLNSSEWKASAEDTTRKASNSPAPVRATVTRLTFSVAISHRRQRRWPRPGWRSYGTQQPGDEPGRW